MSQKERKHTTPPRYDEAFRAGAVRMVTEQGRPSREVAKEPGISQSMPRKGDPYDNAVAESFFSCLKCECVHLKHFSSRAEAKTDIFAYIETFYNPIRPHSSIGWDSPDAFARSLSASHAA